MPTYYSSQPPKITLSHRAIYVAQKDIYAIEFVSGKIQQRYSLQAYFSSTTASDTIYLNNHQTNLVQALRISDGVQLWSYKVEGTLCLSPTVVGNNVYISTNEGNIYALKASNGILLWRYKAYPLLNAFPTVYEDTAYVASVGNSSSLVFVPASSASIPLSEPTLYALRTSDGTCLWRSPLLASTSFPLVVRDEHIYLTIQEECIALSAEDGSLLWRHKTGGFCRSGPVMAKDIVLLSYSVFQVARDKVNPARIKRWQETFLCALWARDGSLCWQQPLRTDREGRSSIAYNLSNKGSSSEVGNPLGGDPTVPYFNSNTVYVGVGGTLLAFSLENGRPLWHYYTEGTFLSEPIATNEAVYVGANDGYVYALRSDNGAFLWRTYVG